MARRVERYLSYREPDGVSVLFRLAIDHARAAMDDAHRAGVAARVRGAVAQSGRTRAALAELVGTRALRFSTDLSGEATSSVAMLVRIEQAARR